MDRKLNRLQQWLDTAVAGIRFGPDRKAVREEICAHLEDKAADFQRIFPDISPEEAEARAVEEMGDAEILRADLAKIHKPWLGYLWLCSKVLIGVLIVLLVGRSLYTDHYYGTGTGSQLWDWDDLPRLSEGYLTGLTGSLVNTYTGEEIYTPGSAPEQLFARSYGGRQDAEVNGQTVSFRRAALWQGDRGQELFVWFRVQDWRFWERGSLYREWFVVTDSLGNRYNVGWDQGCYALSKSESGPFFEGWQLYLRNVDPEAEWVRVEYGLTEPSFSFTVDLERG